MGRPTWCTPELVIENTTRLAGIYIAIQYRQFQMQTLMLGQSLDNLGPRLTFPFWYVMCPKGVLPICGQDKD